MNNVDEASRWLKDARACLRTSQDVIGRKDWRAAIQNAQLCIELSAKAVIAYFAEPEWTHNVRRQLIGILDDQKEEMLEGLELEIIQRLYRLAEEVGETAPWHGRSTYGEERDGVWTPAVELCKRGKAKELLSVAERSLESASKFLKLIRSTGS